jgi:endonuclease/exonuclease/phosphatase (EEP) superfamily protein YafD
VWTGAVGLAVLVAVRALGVERGTAMTLPVGALPLTLLPAYALVVLAALWRRCLLTAVALGFVVTHVLVIAPAVGGAPVPARAAVAPRLRVVVANLYVLNPDPAAAGRFLRGLDADVVVVPELDARGLRGLRRSRLLEDLPTSSPSSVTARRRSACSAACRSRTCRRVRAAGASCRGRPSTSQAHACACSPSTPCPRSRCSS